MTAIWVKPKPPELPTLGASLVSFSLGTSLQILNQKTQGLLPWVACLHLNRKRYIVSPLTTEPGPQFPPPRISCLSIFTNRDLSG